MPGSPPPQLPAAPLLCCICHDSNTTFRYEVVCRQQNQSLTILSSGPASPAKPAQEESVESEDSAQYYNFPARHPRHGHLCWSATYPDHPVHIPTLTLKRITSLIASKERRGNN